MSDLHGSQELLPRRLMAQASQSVVNVHDGVNERIQKCENPHSRNASNRHRPQTND